MRLAYDFHEMGRLEFNYYKQDNGSGFWEC